MTEQEVNSRKEAFKEKHDGEGYTCETVVRGDVTTESCFTLGSNSHFLGEFLLTILVFSLIAIIGVGIRIMWKEL